jgi:hypothetical protein
MLNSSSGDFGEFIVGIQAYENIKGIKLEKLMIQQLMRQYILSIASTSRPFYYHTSNDEMDMMFKKLKPSLVILPKIQPTNLLNWNEELIKPEHQGCTFIQTLLRQPQNMSIPDVTLVHFALQSLFELYWTTELNTLIEIDILHGVEHPSAFVSISNTGCLHDTPSVAPNKRGSSIFIHHPSVTQDFRSSYSLEFYKKYDSGIDTNKLITEMNLISKNQLGFFMANDPKISAVTSFNVKIQSIVAFAIPLDQIDFFVKWSLVVFVSVLGVIVFMVLESIFCFFVGSSFQKYKKVGFVKFKSDTDNSFFKNVSSQLYEGPASTMEQDVKEFEIKEEEMPNITIEEEKENE